MHPIRAAEKGHKRSFVQKTPLIFGVFSLMPPVTREQFVAIRALYGLVVDTKLKCQVTSGFKARFRFKNSSQMSTRLPIHL